MALSGSTLTDLGGAASDLFSWLGTQYKIEGLQFEEENYQAASQLALQNEQFTKTSTFRRASRSATNTFADEKHVGR